ncbi:translation initiation factor IF-2-like isoform X2 [Dermacentor silvarum]|uniref:translation initiation factor IF-2-like isoform X1 n=1 Tax=Dermacentor silvarum TaxID=543639 RepID=UPI001898D33C|nr:translation initiation factor IF-2-like isoform X1 [Dermacentor silvarum]XP_049511820.1 translation initiation factor IF-2-like isoform X2 [Dermacentor silvarum]
MRYIAIFLATVCFSLINGQRNRTKTGPEKCGDLEIPAPEKDQKDHFCRPSHTPSWELEKPRRCVCKKGYVRNSWGECISKTHCWSCKLRRYKDWHSCASGCPARCGQPLEASCRKKCKPRCECPPGFVVHPKYSSKCVKADTCPPKCPRNSSFKPCVSNCEPKCNGERPEKCVSRCDTGGCVCNKGYAYFIRNGQRICVLESACALYAPPPLSFTSKELESSGRGEGSHDRGNGPGGAARRRERTRSRGGQTGPDENLSLGIPRPGLAGGMPGIGAAAHGESEETGHPPFARGPAGALPHVFRGSTPPPGTEGHFRAGTGPNPMRNVSTPGVGTNIHSFSAASRVGLGAMGAGLGVLGAGGMLSRGSERHGGAGRGVLGAGSLLSRGSEGHGRAGIGIQPSGTPSNGAPRHRGSSTDESSEGPHPPAPGGLGGLGAV